MEERPEQVDRQFESAAERFDSLETDARCACDMKSSFELVSAPENKLPNLREKRCWDRRSRSVAKAKQGSSLASDQNEFSRSLTIACAKSRPSRFTAGPSSWINALRSCVD